MKYKGDGKKYVEGLFPELQEIADPDVRQKVIDCWLMALEESQWKCIENMRWIPGKMTVISNVQHCRGVARVGLAMARVLNSSSDVAPGASVNVDTVVAGGLLHDVGKLLEYTGPSNDTGDKTPLDKRMLHHYTGTYLAIKAGLSAEIVHCIQAHREPESFKRTLEAHIVSWADLCHACSIFRILPEAEYVDLMPNLFSEKET